MATTDSDRVRAPPLCPLFEIIPMKGVEEQPVHLLADAVVTVTSSPTRGLDPRSRSPGPCAGRAGAGCCRTSPRASCGTARMCATCSRGWPVSASRSLRDRRTHLPIYIGLPEVVDFAHLLRVSKRMGIGDSVRFLRTQWSTIARLASGYQPDELVAGLGSTVADPAMNVAGWHLLTFNEIRRTEAWRQRLLAP